MYMLSIHFAHQKSSPTKLYDENVRAFFVVNKEIRRPFWPFTKEKRQTRIQSRKYSLVIKMVRGRGGLIKPWEYLRIEEQ